MTSKEVFDYPERAVEEAISKLKRDPFGRGIISAYCDRRGADYDYFNDDGLIMRAAKLIQQAKSPEDQQSILNTIDRDLRILNGYIMRRDLPDVRPVISGFFAKVEEAMRQRNCIPMKLTVQSVSQKTYDSLGRILELTRPTRPK
jgi:hypothetical protein